MTRRKLLLTTVGLVAALAVPAAAREIERDVAARLGREGFRITSRSRTWLGRVRIEATKGGLLREIVLDPSTGEILRDYTDDSGVQVAGGETGSGGKGSTAGSGSSATGDGGAEPEPHEGSEPDGEGSGAGEEPSKEPREEPSGETGERPSKEPSKESSKGWSREKTSKESTGVRK